MLAIQAPTTTAAMVAENHLVVLRIRGWGRMAKGSCGV